MSLRPAFLLILLAAFCFDAAAQSAAPPLITPVSAKIAPANSGTQTSDIDSVKPNHEVANISGKPLDKGAAEKAGTPDPSLTQFRVERIPVAGGAELLTIFGRLDGLRTAASNAPEVPLVSVLRDTLADNDPENDRLRYVWMLSYARPSLMKRIASGVPFLYQPVGNQTRGGNGPPKPIIDLANPGRQTWNHFFWTGLQTVLLDSYGMPLKAASRTYRRNAADYRSGHVFQALSILDNYEKLRQRARGENELLALGDFADKPTIEQGAINDTTSPLLPDLAAAFSPGEMLEIRARLILSGNAFGGLLGPDTFHNTVIKGTMLSIDQNGHNWELLRQRAEAEGLYFEPLKMPDGQASHAILWVAKSDLVAQSNRAFQKRFLNIANPWSDQKLRNWKGYAKTVFFDADNHIVAAGQTGARPAEMIPLALYGLDHPKIPALLIDFRDHLNPKKREMSRRVFNDLAKNIFSLSNFGSLPYFLGRSVYDFITGRRGMDLNQPTRLRSYSELKLLLSFNSSIDANLRREIERRVQNVSLNPLNNDGEAEALLARQQYEALMDYALRADGLSARIERDRCAEMVRFQHGRTARFFYTLGNVFSFGRYVHREQATQDLYQRLELGRRIDYHARFLNEVAKSSPQTEVAWDMAMVKRSLKFLAEQANSESGGAAKAVSAIFEKSSDDEARGLSLEALSRINSKTARKELLRLYQKQSPESVWRADIAARLRKAVTDDAGIKPAEARSLLTQIGQQ